MKLEERRTKWLVKAQDLAKELDAIRDIIDDSYRPISRRDEDAEDDMLERLEKAAMLRCAMIRLEGDGEPVLGVSALIDENNIGSVIRNALTLMILGCVTDRFTGRTRDITDLASLAACNNLTDALELRCALRNDSGILRPVIKLEPCRGGHNLQCHWIELRENAFNRAMGLPEDRVFEGIE